MTVFDVSFHIKMGHSYLNEQRSQLTRIRKLVNLKVDLARTRLIILQEYVEGISAHTAI